MPTERPRDNQSDSRDGRRPPAKRGDGDGARGEKRDDDRGRSPRRDGARPVTSREDRVPDLAGPQKWGRIARGGAGRMESPAIGSEGFDDFPQKRPRRPRPEAEPQLDENGEPIEVIAEGEPEPERKGPPVRERGEAELPSAADLQRHAAKAVGRSRGPAVRERKPLGARPQRVEDPAIVLKRLVGEDRAKSLGRKLRDAGGAFEADRFGDAQTLLRAVVKEAPDLADGRELMGLSFYRMGKWREAISHLEAFRELTHSTDQHPVLADCHRAVARWNDVDALWKELGEASPSSELVTEGRIVVAGALADQGDLSGAIRTLEQKWKLPKRPGDQHLRRAYALADLYDRAGKAARARELFKWIAGHDPHFADVRSRVKALS